MFGESYSFPHPVLGNDDDIEGEFNVSMALTRTGNRTILFDEINVDLKNNYLLRLLQEGVAKVFVKVHCSSTFMTWMLEATSKFELNENEIDNKVEVQYFIVTTEVMSNYSDASFNKQYGSQVFNLGKYEVIAISGVESIKIPKVNEKLGLGNIFKFHWHQTDWPISFQVQQDKIFINYPVTKRGEHPPNMLFSMAHPWTAYNLFIVPALAEALRFSDEDPISAQKLAWFPVLEQMLPLEDRTKDFYADAQLMLRRELPVLLACEEIVKR